MKKLSLISLIFSLLFVFSCEDKKDTTPTGVTLWGEVYSVEKTTELNLYHSQLTGEIPPEIGNLTDLTYLSLGYNQLTGEISPEIGNLTNLFELDLYDNQLTGEIPSEIWEMTNLDRLDLSNNQLTGEIPSEIGNLTNLIYLSLGSNQLTSIPEEICNIYPFEGYFSVSNNSLCPPYPSCIQDYVGTQDTSNCG